MVTHSSTLAWKIPWTEEPGRLQSVGSQRESDTTELLYLLSISVTYYYEGEIRCHMVNFKIY